MNLNAENLTVESYDNVVRVEPQYIEYLRSHQYEIVGITEAHAVESASNPDTAHVVMKVVTYDKPKTASDYLDYPIELWVCDCWAFREGSADVSESLVKPTQSDPCRHIQAVSKVKKAENDDSQETLL